MGLEIPERYIPVCCECCHQPGINVDLNNERIFIYVIVYYAIVHILVV